MVNITGIRCHFELESGAHFKLELGGQYHWNLQTTTITEQMVQKPKSRILEYQEV
ncbi:hypothetical protein QLS31_16155 [Flavobacterium sp. XS2P24]|uniref:hypothetical protein n=1 Tax=Flavobacterium sp. XS2P24 TaxID=3041249 RepID=UPI0024A8577C|nr:hypothetical protein [Flavobacterium sp. XS2P24]MDI6051359.1 hypothetical protein [Flavobacterium sp. XS2P24]